jgi:hypothetical protein
VEVLPEQVGRSGAGALPFDPFNAIAAWTEISCIATTS